MKEILTMKKVTKTFGSGHTKVSALKGIDFYVKEGNSSALLVLLVQVKVLFSPFQEDCKHRLPEK
ncbi:hypothetical protein O3Q50_03410 [Enterococcus lactis]